MIRIISEEFIDNQELEILLWLLDSGLDYYHFRKIDVSEVEIMYFLNNIPFSYRGRIVLHHNISIPGFLSHHKANACQFANNNIHSCSVHSSTEALMYIPYYPNIFWSPVFDSISKQGYKQNEKICLLEMAQKHRKQFIALGGIQPSKFSLVKQMGFSQIAIKGWFWMRKMTYKQAWREIQTTWQE